MRLVGGYTQLEFSHSHFCHLPMLSVQMHLLSQYGGAHPWSWLMSMKNQSKKGFPATGDVTYFCTAAPSPVWKPPYHEKIPPP